MVNPITVWWYSQTTWSLWIFVVPLTILVWFAARWTEVTRIANKSNRWEIVLGLALFFGNITRNMIVAPGYGLFDMLVSFVSVSIGVYGLTALRNFTLPVVYLSVMIVGYQIESSITQVVALEDFLSEFITFTLNLLTISATRIGNVVTLYGTQGKLYSLMIDAGCTGFKGMLAYGSLAILMVLDVKGPRNRKLLAVAVGVVGTFLINMLRLLIIFLSCYFFGIDVSMVVHAHLGYTVFLVWMFIYWWFCFRYILKPSVGV